jgi:hypothetical protein
MSDSIASVLFSKLGQLWCSFAHDQMMWPINGKYQCRRCLRYHEIRWAKATPKLQSEVKIYSAPRISTIFDID